jgi:hypothetical protein
MKTFDDIFDECVNRINSGETIEACLASYPEHAADLELLLQAMLDTRAACEFTPSITAKNLARQRFNEALAQLERKREEQQPLFPWIFARPKAWAAVTAVLVVVLIGYFGLRPMLSSVGPGAQPGPEGSFAFLISDEVNAIEDFQSLYVTISTINLHLSGEDSRWIELEPAEEEVDLTLLQGEKAQQIWSGNITAGRYTKVFINVSEINGILKSGEPVDVKLPSGTLQISKPFEVTSSSVTNFVYDLTVNATGNAQSGMKYMLKPQAGQSGADQKFELVDGKGKGQQHKHSSSQSPVTKVTGTGPDGIDPPALYMVTNGQGEGTKEKAKGVNNEQGSDRSNNPDTGDCTDGLCGNPIATNRGPAHR